MLFVSASSTASETHRALAELCAVATHRLKGSTPDLVIAFISSKHLQNPGDAAAIGAALRTHFPTALFLGTTGHGVLGDGREIEGRPGMSLLAAVLPGVELRAFHLTPEDVPAYAGAGAAGRWRRLLDPPDEVPELVDQADQADSGPPHPAPTPAPALAGVQTPTVLLLPEPFAPGLEALVAGIDAAWPGGRVVGGIASGFREPGQHRLILDDEIHASGVLGLILYGDVEVELRVAQGCRPVGQPLFVTSAQGHRLLGLDGQPAVDVLERTYEVADDVERERMGQSLFLGLGLVGRESYGRGDFLVRHILGAERETGALLVQAHLQEGQVVQFHVRDGQASEDDLRLQLETIPEGAVGALAFMCVGRGQALYGVPDHDLTTLADAYGDLPVAGFFCNGEIGPVNGATHLHGYTASLMFFRPAGPR